nr:MAG TPA: hypothetical protein [Caudoviricetes sp.]
MQIGKGWRKRVYKRERRDALLFLKKSLKMVLTFFARTYIIKA